MNALVIVIVLFAILLSALAEVFLGLWVYRDAKARGLNAVLWTIVVLVVPSFIGLIIYLVAGRNQSTGLCPNCSRAIQPNVKFCPSCGGTVGSGEDPAAPAPRPLPRTGKGLLIAFIVCIALMVVGSLACAAIGLFAFNTNRQNGFASNISIGSVENHTSRNWYMSFMSLDGEKKSSALRFDGKTPAQVHVEASLGSGKLQLVLTQGDKRTAVDLSSPNSVSNIDLTDFEPGEIDMALVAEDARDGTVDISWD